MQTIIKSIDRTITSKEIIPLLNKYGMLSRLAYEDIIDRAIAKIDCTPQEIAVARGLWQHQQKRSQTPLGDIALAIRSLKIEKFKQQTWGDCIPAYFARRKKQLDRVTYSIVKTKQSEVAREIYFRLTEKEQTFAELIEELSQECRGNPSIEASESIGLVELATLPPSIAKQLANLQTYSVSLPFAAENWFVIVRLEKYVSATCDRAMKKRLIDELFNRWMQQQLAQQKYHLQNTNSLEVASSGDDKV